MKLRGSLFFLGGLAPALAAGWIAFPRVLYRSAGQPLSFSHAAHTGEKGGMPCTDCHALGADGRFSGVPRLEKCVGCHGQAIGASAAEKLFVDEYVANGREVPWLVYARQPENVHFPHAAHVVRAKVPCERCHGAHGTTDRLRPYEENRISGYSRDIWGPGISRVARRPWEGMKMTDCVSCHEGRGRGASCLACHR